MPARSDLISVVEATYDLSASETAWLEGVATAFQSVLQAEDGLLAYHVDIDEDGLRIHDPVHVGDSTLDMLAQIRSMADLLERRRRGHATLFERLTARVYERVIRTAVREPVDHLLASEHRRIGPSWMYDLGAPIADTFALLSHHVDHNGITGLFGGLKRRRALRAGERATYQMLSAHIKAGFRLRRRLGSSRPQVDAPDEGAVLTPSGDVLHAEGAARDEDARDELAARARQIDRARTRDGGRGEDALAIWQGLVRGSWSLVEQYDADGKRFVLAHRNPEDVRDPRGLSDIEVRVVGLAVRGYADKLIAYHLGIPEGTVSSHLTHAMRKLRIPSRVALVRQLGRRFPQRAL